jgi:hypothetical protein
MNKIIGIYLLFFSLQLVAQPSKSRKIIKIPMTPERWEYTSEKVSFIQHRSVPSIKIMDAGEGQEGKISLKDFIFSDGTIEYDIELSNDPFAFISFRKKNELELEEFYLRTGTVNNPNAMEAIQYMPIIKGVSTWNLYGHYQGPAVLKSKDWNHVKLVVSGKQMRVYVNDMNQPALQIPKLEGNTTSGGIAFSGGAIIANLIIIPNQVDGLDPNPGIDPMANDPRYIRNWKISEPYSLPFKQEITAVDVPKTDQAWQHIVAESRGLVNLSKLYGKSQTRQAVWLKVKINAKAKQVRKINLGFCNEVWVFINNNLIYIDKNFYGTPIMKQPAGRISIENTAFNIPLEAGENEILIGLTNEFSGYGSSFWGWGLMARFDALDGIEFL